MPERQKMSRATNGQPRLFVELIKKPGCRPTPLTIAVLKDGAGGLADLRACGM